MVSKNILCRCGQLLLAFMVVVIVLGLKRWCCHLEYVQFPKGWLRRSSCCEVFVVMCFVCVLQKNWGVTLSEERRACPVYHTYYRVSVSYGGLWLAVTVRTPPHSAPCVVGAFSSGDQETGPLSLAGAEDFLWRYGLVNMRAVFIGQSCISCLTVQLGIFYGKKKVKKRK